MSDQTPSLTSLPALSPEALKAVKNNEACLLQVVVQATQLRNPSQLRRELRTVATSSFTLYLDDYGNAGYRVSQSLMELVSEELCETLAPLCVTCLRKSEVEYEINTSIQEWIKQTRKKQSRESFQNVLTQLENTILQGVPAPQKDTPASPHDDRTHAIGVEAISHKPYDPRREKLLNEYKTVAGNPSNRAIYIAKNSGINKPEFYAWLRGELPDSSLTTINFEKFLRSGKRPIPKK